MHDAAFIFGIAGLGAIVGYVWGYAMCYRPMDYVIGWAAIIIGILALAGFIVGVVNLTPMAREPRCAFDRNEPGPQGRWWDVYKCSDGKRRQLVASPRG